MHFNNILSSTIVYLKRFLPFIFSNYDLCLSPANFCLLCPFRLYTNLNFFEVFVRITSLQLRIYIYALGIYYHKTAWHFKWKKVYCFYVWVYSCGRSYGTIWRQCQWTCMLLSSPILQKHLDRRKSAATLKSFTHQDRNWDAEQRVNSCPLSHAKMLSVIIDTWWKYLSLGVWINKQRQINGKI